MTRYKLKRVVDGWLWHDTLLELERQRRKETTASVSPYQTIARHKIPPVNPYAQRDGGRTIRVPRVDSWREDEY